MDSLTWIQYQSTASCSHGIQPPKCFSQSICTKNAAGCNRHNRGLQLSNSLHLHQSTGDCCRLEYYNYFRKFFRKKHVHFPNYLGIFLGSQGPLSSQIQGLRIFSVLPCLSTLVLKRKRSLSSALKPKCKAEESKLKKGMKQWKDMGSTGEKKIEQFSTRNELNWN